MNSTITLLPAVGRVLASYRQPLSECPGRGDRGCCSVLIPVVGRLPSRGAGRRGRLPDAVIASWVQGRVAPCAATWLLDRGSVSPSEPGGARWVEVCARLCASMKRCDIV
jgi:hypothetical protein